MSQQIGRLGSAVISGLCLGLVGFIGGIVFEDHLSAPKSIREQHLDKYDKLDLVLETKSGWRFGFLNAGTIGGREYYVVIDDVKDGKIALLGQRADKDRIEYEAAKDSLEQYYKTLELRADGQ